MNEMSIYKMPCGAQRQSIEELLNVCGLRWETTPDETAVIFRGGRAAATGSRSGCVLQYMAVRPEYEGEGLCEEIVSRLTERAFAAGVFRLFLFTKPSAAAQFIAMGYTVLAETASMTMLENSSTALDGWLKSLPRGRGGRTGAIVANANPFTRGHLHLVERAAAECDTVHLFILSEEASFFSAAERLEMARAATAHLENVMVHPGGKYIISSVTFPSYFIKDIEKAQNAQMELDATLFARRIAPALGVSVRYVGEEPFCPVTAEYNRVLQAVLPRWGVELKVIPRLESISASRVRALLAQGQLEELRGLVPEGSYECIRRRA